MTVRAKRLKRKSTVRRKRDPIPWKYCLLTLICGLILVAGFFYAARQHFASMSYGIENAKLRKEIDKLKSSERLHKLKREIALSPAEIKKAAKKFGLQTMTAKNIETVKDKKLIEKQNLTKNKKKEEKTKSVKEAKKKVEEKSKKAKDKDKDKKKDKSKQEKTKVKKNKDKKKDKSKNDK